MLEVIADGHHVRPEVLEATFRMAPGRIALISDAMAAAGAAGGRYVLGGLEVEAANRLAKLVGADTLAGSALTQDAALRKSVNAGVDLVEAVTALTATPAKVLGRDDELGLVKPGLLADLVILSSSLHVEKVIAAGHNIRLELVVREDIGGPTMSG